MNTVERPSKLLSFLDENVPDVVQYPQAPASKSEFLSDIEAGLKMASMSVRLTPYILSLINWDDLINDPIRRQFMPLLSLMMNDHGLAQLDSLGETGDMPVKNLVHRYPDKVLFLGKSVAARLSRLSS